MAVLDWRREDISAVCSLVQRCEEELNKEPWLDRVRRVIMSWDDIRDSASPCRDMC